MENLLRSVNSSLLFKMRKICLITVMSLLSYDKGYEVK
jgi:hypothetical protein